MPSRPPTFRPQGYRPAQRAPQPYDSTGFYHSPGWKADKAAVKVRSGGRCERIRDGARCENAARTVNHKERSKTGQRVPLIDLEHLCPGCDNRFHAEKAQR